MRLSVVQKADEHERFARDAFDSQIGKTIQVSLGSQTRSGTLVAAEVRPDGRSVALTVEVAATALPA